MERPSSSAIPMQRLSAVVAPDSIQTPWIVPSSHPARCDKQFLRALLPLSGLVCPWFPFLPFQAISGLNCGLFLNARAALIVTVSPPMQLTAYFR